MNGLIFKLLIAKRLKGVVCQKFRFISGYFPKNNKNFPAISTKKNILGRIQPRKSIINRNAVKTINRKI